MEHLKAELKDKMSRIKLLRKGLDKAFEYDSIIPFTPFVCGVIEAYEKIYGRLILVSEPDLSPLEKEW